MSKKRPTAALLTKKSFASPLLVLLIVFVVATGYLFVRLSHAASGVMSIQPVTTTAAFGSNVTVAIRVNSGTDAINAVQANLTYPVDKLEFVSIDATTSAFGVQADNTGGSGTVSIARGVNGGSAPVTGDVLVANITFKTLATGSATIGVAASSVALRATDSTDVLVARNAGTVNITDQTAPSVPTALVKSSSTLNSITLGWTASTDNVAVTGYRIYRAGISVGTSATTSFTDTGLTPGTSYLYSVGAYDAAGNTSVASTTLSAATLPDTTAPTVPTAITATSRTLTGITLGWTVSTDNVAVTGYKVFRAGVQIGTTATPSYSDTGLTPGTSYAYGVAAYDAAGNTSAASAASSLATLADTTAPSVPAGLTASGQTATAVTLTWSASTDNVAVTSYKIFRDGVQVATSSSATATVALPATAGIYNFTVAAADAVGNTSAASTAVAVTTYLPSDINRDGKIDIFDLSNLLSHWGGTGTADVTGDGIVNIFDLSKLLSTWTG